MRIERHVTIAASLDRVWELVTEPAWWVGHDDDLSGFEVREGARFSGYGYPTVIARVEPKRYIAYRWASAFPGQEPDPGKGTLVELTLTTEGDHVRLTVIESGFDQLDAPDEARRKAVEDNTGGWEHELNELKMRAEKSDE
jgi:uncharacterized protein YndB with AHSA1/START domain